MLEENLAAGVQGLGRFVRAVEEIGGGTDSLEGVAGKQDVAGTRGEGRFGVGPQNFAPLSGEDETNRLFFRIGCEERRYQYRNGGKTAKKSGAF